MFDCIVGHQAALRVLSSFLPDCPQSLLLEGPEGVGKRSIALELARALTCTQPVYSFSCPCESCEWSRKGQHPDIQVFVPENLVFKVDMVREVKEVAYFLPALSRNKVLILDRVDTMNLEASNALLKLLEDPPEFTTIALIAHTPYELLPTVESRVYRIPFHPLSPSEVLDILGRLGEVVGDSKGRLLSKLSGGSVTQALSYARGGLWEERVKAFRLFGALWKGNSLRISSLTREFGTTVDEVRRMVSYFQSFLRDVWVLKGGGLGEIQNEDFEEELRPLASVDTQVLTMVTSRTVEMGELLGKSTLEVQVPAYFASLSFMLSMQGNQQCSS